MPHKYNTARRHHIPKAKFKVTNWAEYEAGLRQRGSLTLWITDEAIDAWGAAARATPGGQATYFRQRDSDLSDAAHAFTLALRQAEGLMTSVVELLGCELAVPDHTTVSRRAIKLPLIATAALPEGPLHVLIEGGQTPSVPCTAPPEPRGSGKLRPAQPPCYNASIIP